MNPNLYDSLIVFLVLCIAVLGALNLALIIEEIRNAKK